MNENNITIKHTNINHLICDSQLCTSCGACATSCNQISMTDCESGFLRPTLSDTNQEILATDFTCPQFLPFAFHTSKFAYALQHRDKKILLESTSGGAFSALAQYVFGHQGVVYGAAFDDHLNVRHFRATTMEDIIPMRGSKYIQSDMTGCYKALLDDINAKKLVLFSGLPCQIAAIYAYCKAVPKNLITVDLVCSGVPSQKLFQSFRKDMEKRKHISIINIKFRDKHDYGLSHTTVIEYLDRHKKSCKKVIKDRTKITYYVAFGKQNCFMDACYSCRYAGIERISDFTIGGFWGANAIDCSLNANKGISLVLANTLKSEQILCALEPYAEILRFPLEVAQINNNALIHCTSKALQEKKLYSCLDQMGYRKTAKRYFPTRRSIIGRMQKRCKQLYNKVKK